MAMPVIATYSLPARRLLGVLVTMAVIPFRIPWQLSQSSRLFSPSNDGPSYQPLHHPSCALGL